MSMFSHSAIASLNNLEMMVYNYVIKNRDKVMYMTIRELADAAGVSTTTILRFCRKLNCDGYSEFRVRFKLYLEQNEPQQANFGASEIISFFKSVNNEEFDALLDNAVDIILSSERINFCRCGHLRIAGKIWRTFLFKYREIQQPYRRSLFPGH